MSLSPLIAAGPLVQTHVLAAVSAVVLGAAQFVLPKGTLRHRILGRTWVALMAVVALGSLGIHALRQIGPFSWIHGISLVTLAMLALAVAHGRAGRIAAHR